MSLYLGNNTSNSKILHITKNSRNITDMKSGVLYDTMFHSDLNYVFMQRYYATITNSVLHVTQELKNLMLNNPCFIVSSSGEWVPPFEGYHQSHGTSAGTWNSDGLSINLGYFITNTYGESDIAYYGTRFDGTCSIYILTNITATTFTPIVKTSNDIVLNNTTFNIGGFNLLSTGFIQRTQINTADPLVYVQNQQFQFVNINNVATELSLISNSTGTTISKGTNPIIDTSLGTPMEYRTTASIYLPSNPGNYSTYLWKYSTYSFGQVVNKGFCALYFPGQDGISALGALFPIPMQNSVIVRLLVILGGLYALRITINITTTEIVVGTGVIAARPVSFPAQNMHVHIFY